MNVDDKEQKDYKRK